MAAKKTAKKVAPFMSIKNIHLSTLCGLIGLPKSGIKDTLAQRLAFGVKQPRIDWKNTPIDCARILSIDMGIRNLAYCVMDVQRKSIRSPGMDLNVLEWNRVDLTELTSTSAVEKGERLQETFSQNENTPKDKKDVFHPPSLAAKAYDFLKNHLLPHQPTIILIERQRFREGGGSAVLEWTLRVNMLESMLWAVLETLKQESIALGGTKTGFHDLDVFAVPPKAVAQFWVEEQPNSVSAPSTAEVKSITASRRKKIDKKDKIALVHEWLESPAVKIIPRITETNMTVNEPLSITFSKQAERMRQAFCRKPNRARKVPTKDGNNTKSQEVDVKKRDDLADSFLQAAAWVAWEQNRLKVETMLQSNTDETNILPLLLGAGKPKNF